MCQPRKRVDLFSRGAKKIQKTGNVNVGFEYNSKRF